MLNYMYLAMHLDEWTIAIGPISIYIALGAPNFTESSVNVTSLGDIDQ